MNRFSKLSVAAFAAFAVLAPTAAHADPEWRRGGPWREHEWHGDRDGWREGGHDRGWGWRPPFVVVSPRAVAPPPVYYAPPPVYYAPPPVYYAPPVAYVPSPQRYYAPAPVYAPPSLSLGVNIPLR